LRVDGVVTPRDAVRASTVDNFQGEEANIIIASLVRSNAAGKLGFLNEPQRVNVLLSRARDALILIGNANCLRGERGITVTTGASSGQNADEVVLQYTATSPQRGGHPSEKLRAWEQVRRQPLWNFLNLNHKHQAAVGLAEA
jgi:hypothetical protein